jgi:hypothetical protein
MMVSAMTPEASATPSGDIPSSPAVDFPALRKEVAVFIAHRLSLSLFQADAKDRLRVEITRLTDERLNIKRLKLDEPTHAKLIDDLIDGIPSKSPTIPEVHVVAPKEAIRAEIVSSLARLLNDTLLEPGREADLVAAISRVVRNKVDSLPTEQKEQVSYNDLLTTVLTGINPKLTSFLKEEEPAKIEPVEEKKPGQAAAKAAEPETVLDPLVEEEEVAEKSAEPEDLTQDELRALLFEIAGRMDFDAVERKDRDAVGFKIDEVLKEHPQVELSAEVMEQLVDGILSGGAVEFQL